MRGPALPIALAALAGSLALATPAAAQLHLNGYAGFYRFDDGPFEDFDPDREVDPSPLIGARLGIGDRFEIGYGFSPITVEDAGFGEALERDAGVHLFYGAFNYHLPIPAVDLFLSAGGGIVRLEPEEGDGSTDPLVNFGAGVTFPISPLLLFRADVKDHIDFCEGQEGDEDFTACFDDETLHNVEVSAGLQIGL
ncbi:MAG: hypothetical protein R3199_04420 [Gemmatimonadota bacterium]|nr:hypothetical protein [Gemmatimonadota bacterium]